jgi:hypothetical protein
VAKRFKNGGGTAGLKNSMTKRALGTERLRSVLHEAFRASERGKWPKATDTARKSAELPDRWVHDTATKEKVIFVLWAEPLISFKKEISILSEIDRVTKASMNTDNVHVFVGSLPG